MESESGSSTAAGASLRPLARRFLAPAAAGERSSKKKEIGTSRTRLRLKADRPDHGPERPRRNRVPATFNQWRLNMEVMMAPQNR